MSRSTLRLAVFVLVAASQAAPAAAARAAGPATFHDDWPGALAAARAQGRPIFVDVWTPWCHSCRYMRATVLKDPRLAQAAARHVWLSIDAEAPKNARFLERFPVDSYPTFLVVDARAERAVAKWIGTAEPAQLAELLEQGAAPAAAGADGRLERADRALADGRLQDATEGYRAALAEGGADWPRRPRALASLVATESAAQRQEPCAATARAEAPGMARGGPFVAVVTAGLACALGAPAEEPWRAEALAGLEPLAEEAVTLPDLLADDRSGVFEVLTEARQTADDAAGVQAMAERWWAFLEEDRRRAKGAEARSALDGHRVAAAFAADDPARALPALADSERALPRDYNPPVRRAAVLRELGRLPEARAAVERALTRAYGPRKLMVYALELKILQDQRDRPALLAAVDRALAYARSLPRSQQDDRIYAVLRAQRDALAPEAVR